jgi:hypothetical protein
MKTSWTAEEGTFEFSMAFFIAMAPSWGAVNDLRREPATGCEHWPFVTGERLTIELWRAMSSRTSIHVRDRSRIPATALSSLSRLCEFQLPIFPVFAEAN